MHLLNSVRCNQSGLTPYGRTNLPPVGVALLSLVQSSWLLQIRYQTNGVVAFVLCHDEPVTVFDNRLDCGRVTNLINLIFLESSDNSDPRYESMHLEYVL